MMGNIRQNSQQELTVCIICSNEFIIDSWAKLLTRKFDRVFLISSPGSLPKILSKQLSPADDISTFLVVEALPSLIDVAFVYELDQEILSAIDVQFSHIFKYFTSTSTVLTGKELPIYRKFNPQTNDIGVNSKDIEEVISYITRETKQIPSMCYPVVLLDSDQEIENLNLRQEFLTNIYSLFKSYRNVNDDFYHLIYKLLGYPQPIVYIFAGYNHYINCENNFCSPKSDLPPREDNTNDFLEMLKEYCLILNNLSLAFIIKAIPLLIPQKQINYKSIFSCLPIDLIEKERSQVAAFIFDLEHPTDPLDNLPENEDPQIDRQQWEKISCYAINILSQHYPEIPNFILTDLSLAHVVQQSLAHGAYWGFQKERISHYSSPLNLTQELFEQLNYRNLQYHLTRAVHICYGAYQTLLFPEQIKLDNQTAPRRKLWDNLKIQVDQIDSSQETIIRKLIAGLLPTADWVDPVKVITNDQYHAQATFFVNPVVQKNRLATQLIKISSWFLIQQEYFAYQKFIQPRLNSYIANIVQKPVIAECATGKLAWGALKYSLVGFTEDYNNLKSLHELFEQYLEQNNGDVILGERIENTLDKVLFPLYKPSIDQARKSELKPLGYWLGDILPPLYTGVLIPLHLTPIWAVDQVKYPIVQFLPNAATDNLIPLTFAQLNEQLQEQKQICEHAGIADPSHQDYNIINQPFKQIFLVGWKLAAVEDVETQSGEVTSFITLSHPHLGIRILLRGQSEDINLRFGANWLRPGMFVNVAVCLDVKNKEFDQIRQRIKESISDFIFGSKGNNIIGFNHNTHHSPLSDDFNPLFQRFLGKNKSFIRPEILPFDVFSSSQMLDNEYPESFLEGFCHGDLNLHNILYPANETVGWLINFAQVKERGAIALDLAKLEVEIWHHHIFPYLATVAELAELGKSDICYRLVNLCLQAVEFPGNEYEFLMTKIRNEKLLSINNVTLLNPITNGLKIVKFIRYFALESCHLTIQELRWFLSAYFFHISKFTCQNGKYKDHIGNASILTFLASIWHLNHLLPK